MVASFVSNAAVNWRSRTEVDDTLDVFPCHGLGGMVGMILTAVFAIDGGVIAGSWTLFVRHLGALLVVTGYTFGMSILLYRLTDAIIPLRVAEDQEAVGLDASQHGEQLTPLGGLWPAADESAA